MHAIGHSETSSIALEMLDFEERYASVYPSLCPVSVSSLEGSAIVDQSHSGDLPSQSFSTKLPSSKKARVGDHAFIMKAHGNSGMTYNPDMAKSMNYLCSRKGRWVKMESAY